MWNASLDPLISGCDEWTEDKSPSVKMVSSFQPAVQMRHKRLAAIAAAGGLRAAVAFV
jgi:hypothetical protein